MIPTPEALQFGQSARRLRIDTLSRLRWLALFGQLTTVLATVFFLKFPLPLGLCLAVIGVSALLNIVFHVRAKKSLRLSDGPATAFLAFDVMQLAALLYLTGGLENPFAMLFLAPATIAAVSLPLRKIALIVILVVLAASFLSFQHLPLPWYGSNGQSSRPLSDRILAISAGHLALYLRLRFASCWRSAYLEPSVDSGGTRVGKGKSSFPTRWSRGGGGS